MLETYLEKYHSNILEEFEKFYESSKIVTSTTPAEKPPLLDTVKLKDDSTIESLPEQDAKFETARTKRLFARSGVGRYSIRRLAVGVNRLRYRPVLGYCTQMKQTFVKEF